MQSYIELITPRAPCAADYQRGTVWLDLGREYSLGRGIALRINADRVCTGHQLTARLRGLAPFCLYTPLAHGTWQWCGPAGVLIQPLALERATPESFPRSVLLEAVALDPAIEIPRQYRNPSDEQEMAQ